MKKISTLQDFKDQLQNWTLLDRYGFYFFDEDTNMDSTELEEPGDLNEFLSMGMNEFEAYMGLFETMNFLEGESTCQAGTDEDWIGRPHHWHGMNAYWIKKYPAAYRYLEVAVWG